MSQWQFMKSGVPTSDPIYDDGLNDLPGDPGFTTAPVIANTPVDADGFNYVGPSASAQV